MATDQIFVNGKVRVAREMCPTCIFRPGNLMHLNSGRLKDMVDQSLERDSTIVCHDTLDKDLQACCRGFFDRYQTTPLVLAAAMEMIEEV